MAPGPQGFRNAVVANWRRHAEWRSPASDDAAVAKRVSLASPHPPIAVRRFALYFIRCARRSFPEAFRRRLLLAERVAAVVFPQRSHWISVAISIRTSSRLGDEDSERPDQGLRLPSVTLLVVPVFGQPSQRPRRSQPEIPNDRLFRWSTSATSRGSWSELRSAVRHATWYSRSTQDRHGSMARAGPSPFPGLTVGKP